MSDKFLKEYYEKDSEIFWNPNLGMVGRDLDVYHFFDSRNRYGYSFSS